MQRVENDILATKRQTLAQALTEYRQHIDASTPKPTGIWRKCSASRKPSASCRCPRRSASATSAVRV